MRPKRVAQRIRVERRKLAGGGQRLVVAARGDQRVDQVRDVVGEVGQLLDRASDRQAALHQFDRVVDVPERSLRIAQISQRRGLEEREADFSG